VWTGEWWENAQKNMIKEKGAAKLLALILYSDKTNLTQKGTQNAHVVNLYFGNMSLENRKLDSGRKLLCYLPIIDNSELSDDEKSKLARRVFHKCMKILLQPLINKPTSIICDQIVYPRLAFYITDWPESLLCTHVKAPSAASPCKFCLEKKEDFNKLLFGQLKNLRSVTQYEKTIDCYIRLRSEKKSKEADDLLQSKSINLGQVLKNKKK
jgi:hypothetical protein